MFAGLPAQRVNGNKAAAVGPEETTFPMLPWCRVNGNEAADVGRTETMFPGLPGVGIHGNKAVAVGTKETMFQGRASLKPCCQGFLGRESTSEPRATFPGQALLAMLSGLL